jgi:SEC-C motif-containing protein
MTTTTDCPCGAGRPFTACCEPYISGKAKAPTAEALMRARYSSFVKGKIDFVEKSHDPETRKEGFDRAGAEKWAKDSTWKGLEIVATKDGGEKDETGIVSFVARFSQDGKDFQHGEISAFRRIGGDWFFVDGQAPSAPTYEKTGPDVGRNDPCHCGSKKKFKKCHGKPA